MAVGEIFNQCQVIELTPSNPKYIIRDEVKLEFFYLIKGRCKIDFEVKRMFDSKSSNETVQELTREEIESKQDISSV